MKKSKKSSTTSGSPIKFRKGRIPKKVKPKKSALGKVSTKKPKAKAEKPKELKEYTPNELSGALFRSKDYLGRAQIPFMVGGVTLKEVLNNQLETAPIHFLVLKKHLTQDSYPMFRDILRHDKKEAPDSLDKEKELTWDVDGVPVRIQIVHRKYHFFGNPGNLSFDYDHGFKMPNPVDNYLRSRGVVR